MGKRQRRRADEQPAAPNSEYSDVEGNLLGLRGSMTAGTRAEYAAVLAGERDAPGAAREDAWHRAAEFLFERLAVYWVVAGVETRGQKDLLARYRFASDDERDFIRKALRNHLADHFPEVEAP